MNHYDTRFRIQIANTVFEVNTIYGATFEMCKNYLCEGEPECEIIIYDEDIEQEKTSADGGAMFPRTYLETLAVYRKIAEYFITKKVFLFHGSAIAVDGEGYLFTAKSGTGKSTHTRLWREFFGERGEMINDDKPLLKLTDEGLFVCGTPWNGKHHLDSNQSVRLKAIVVLERGLKNEIHEISFEEAYPMIFQQTYKPKVEDLLLDTLSLIDEMRGKVRFYKLSCNMNPEAAVVAYEGMQKG